MNRSDRHNAWASAKMAVRAYSRDPSRRNAEQVEDAWAALRQLDTPSHWRAFQSKILDRPDTIFLKPSSRH